MLPKLLSKKNSDEELDLKPFMNLMVVLIPILLISVEFAKISIIDVQLPRGRGVDTTKKDSNGNNTSDSNKLLLTAIISDSAITLGAKNGFLPGIPYKEFHEYVASDDQCAFSVEYRAKAEVLHPLSRRVMKTHERQNIRLYATDDSHAILSGYYTKDNELLTDAAGNPAAAIAEGDTLLLQGDPARAFIAYKKSDVKKRKVSAYDLLKCRLMAVKNRYPDVDDAQAIIIAADHGVLYDKIIKIMDTARESEFPEISIAKLRS